MNEDSLKQAKILSAPVVPYRLLLQLLFTLAVLAWVPGNFYKLLAMLAIWLAGFGRMRCRELLVMLCVNVLFIGMNAGALRKGVFAFTQPDFLGMPIYEFFMWGFYVLHAIRVVEGKVPDGPAASAVLMAVAFAIPFSTIGDASLLTFVSALILLLCCLKYHEPLDLAYIGYMVLLGALIEYTGVWSGQWRYPGDPLGGVPLWFIPMWGGVGLFSRRLILPLLKLDGSQEDARKRS